MSLLQTPKTYLLKEKNTLSEFIKNWPKTQDKLDYGTDGLVFSLNKLSLHKSLGATAHHPRYKLSFKWQGEKAKTKIKKITWQTSRLGFVTPVAELCPVRLSGALISSVSLHNLSFVNEHKLCEADEIEIIRSGEVIPKYLRTTKKGDKTFLPPSLCPSCGTKLFLTR